MKPIYFLIFSCICLVSLSFGSCSKPKTLRIAVSQCSDDDWRRKMNDELRREAMFHSNVELEILSANDNTQTQIDQLRKFAREDFDIIIVAPNEAEDMTPLIDSIYKAGIPVVVFDRGIRSNSFTAFQGADFSR